MIFYQQFEKFLRTIKFISKLQMWKDIVCIHIGPIVLEQYTWSPLKHAKYPIQTLKQIISILKSKDIFLFSTNCMSYK